MSDYAGRGDYDFIRFDAQVSGCQLCHCLRILIALLTCTRIGISAVYHYGMCSAILYYLFAVFDWRCDYLICGKQCCGLAWLFREDDADVVVFGTSF